MIYDIWLFSVQWKVLSHYNNYLFDIKYSLLSDNRAWQNFSSQLQSVLCCRCGSLLTSSGAAAETGWQKHWCGLRDRMMLSEYSDNKQTYIPLSWLTIVSVIILPIVKLQLLLLQRNNLRKLWLLVRTRPIFQRNIRRYILLLFTDCIWYCFDIWYPGKIMF